MFVMVDTERGARPSHIGYILPDGRIVLVDYTACKGASVIDFQLVGGRVVTAVIDRNDPWVMDLSRRVDAALAVAR